MQPREESSRSKWRNAALATWKLEWSEVSARAALRCMPGLALPLVLGLALGDLSVGAVASSGALTIGFASFQQFRHARIVPMLLTCAGISLSALAGTLGGHSALGLTLIAALWAFGCGLLAAFSSGAWWIGLQCTVFVLIASHYPVGIAPAFSRAGLVLAGGLLQTALIAALWRLERVPWQSSSEAPEAEETDRPLSEEARAALRTLRRNLTPDTEVGREALRLAIAVGISAGVSYLLPLHNNYWMPLTTLLVLKADLHQTFTRGLGRIAGTLAGVGLATLLVATLRPGPHLLVVLVLVFAWLCFTLLRANYALYSVCITSYVVFQLALLGLPEAPVVAARALYTALGGILALFAHLLWPTPGKEGTAGPGFDVGT